MTESTGAVKQQLDAILSSSGFRKAEKLAALLRFLVEETLAGRAAELKEYTLGVHVFQRGADFNPQADPIVRVQARNLRAKLDDYYRTAGANDEQIILLEKGSYVPLFRTRATAAVAAVPAAPKVATTIAVLPFTNLSPDPVGEYFSDGLTEELIGELSRLPGLLVAARTSVFVFKQIRLDIREVASRLGVELLVEGSVRRSAERVRVNARLIEASSGFERWSEAFDVPLEDSVDLQVQIARDIAESLKIIWTPEPGHGHFSFKAYELYLQARHHWQERSRPGFEKAIQCLHQSVAADPSFAPAYAGLADCYTLLATYGYLPGKEFFPKAKQLAGRALQMDASSCQALTALGMIAATFEWDYERAEQYFLKAIELQPSYPDARQWYANFVLSTLGRFDAACEQLAQALRSDPLSVTVRGDLGNTLSMAGRHLEGLQQCEIALAATPQFFRPYWQAGLVYERMERFDEAIRTFEQCRERCAGDVFEATAVGSLGHALGVAGRGAEARGCLKELRRMAAGSNANAISFALIHIGLHEFDEAFEWLERAAEARIPAVVWTASDPRGEPLHGDPRFAQLISRLRMAD